MAVTDDKFLQVLQDIANLKQEIYDLKTRERIARALKADAALSVPWAGIPDKPGTFAPSAHQHPGGDITSAVSNATNATNAAAAASVPGNGITGNISGVWDITADGGLYEKGGSGVSHRAYTPYNPVPHNAAWDFAVFRSSNMVIGSGAWGGVSWTSFADEATQWAWNGGGYTIPSNGMYHVMWQIQWVDIGTTGFHMRITDSAGRTLAMNTYVTGSNGGGHQCHFIGYLPANRIIYADVYQASGVNKTIAYIPDLSPYLRMAKIQ